ncbi:unnamed protein product [Mytilus edulis]|uniref:EF-hand domain-containing protein n=1 Tax=Mytilus edulis TaxID=6550 RepID=A0A8S3VHK9_MYTED|nr:unnamed protein product [Mytilus edulis]
MADHDLDKNAHITKEEFDKAFSEKKFKQEYRIVLFGDDCKDFDSIFQALDKNGDGTIAFSELVNYIESTGISLKDMYLSHTRRQATGVFSYVWHIAMGMHENTRRIHFKNEDVDRTVGINTWYIKTTDFDIKEKDKDFMVDCMMLCIIYSAHAQNSRQIKCKYSIGPFAWSYSYCGIKKACCFIDSNWKCIDTIDVYLLTPGLYYDNGNTAAGVAYPRTQLSYGADLERLINSTSDCSASLPTVNPPAYEAIINNGNKTAIDSYNPRTYTGDVEKRHTQHIPNNGTVFTFIDDTKYIPTVSPPAYEDIMKENAAAIVSYNPGTHTQDNEERLANYIANDGTVTHL